MGGLGFGLKFGPVDVSIGSNMSKLVAATASYVIEFCQHHNSSWLTTQRSFFVNARNTFFAGQTGQRGVGGRPQPRFESCIDLAKQVLASRKHTLKGKHSLSVGSRVTSAIRFLKGRLESNAPGSSV